MNERRESTLEAAEELAKEINDVICRHADKHHDNGMVSSRELCAAISGVLSTYLATVSAEDRAEILDSFVKNLLHFTDIKWQEIRAEAKQAVKN